MHTTKNYQYDTFHFAIEIKERVYPYAKKNRQ